MTGSKRLSQAQDDRREEVESLLFRSGADNYSVAVDMLLPLIARREREAAAKAVALRSVGLVAGALEDAADDYLEQQEDGFVLAEDVFDWLSTRARNVRAVALTDVDGVQA